MEEQELLSLPTPNALVALLGLMGGSSTISGSIFNATKQGVGLYYIENINDNLPIEKYASDDLSGAEIDEFIDVSYGAYVGDRLSKDTAGFAVLNVSSDTDGPVISGIYMQGSMIMKINAFIDSDSGDEQVQFARVLDTAFINKQGVGGGFEEYGASYVA